MDSTLEKIIDTFGLPENPKTERIAKSSVLEWMSLDDMEVLGAVYTFIMKSRHASRIFPALEFGDYMKFLMMYYERCFIENQEGEWACGRYSAAWEFNGWFRSLWKDSKVDRKNLVKLKEWLAGIYKRGDEPIRRCIVDGALEHLFENPKIAIFFNDWKKDKLLAKAYAEAAMWPEKRGDGRMRK
jgi:hypothetical protein